MRGQTGYLYEQRAKVRRQINILYRRSRSAIDRQLWCCGVWIELRVAQAREIENDIQKSCTRRDQTKMSWKMYTSLFKQVHCS